MRTLLLLVLSLPLWGADPQDKWSRPSKKALVTSCVVSGLDAVSTAWAVSRGGVEANPWMKGKNGGVRWSVVLPLKGLVCGGGFFVRKWSPRAAYVLGVGQTSVFTWATVNNVKVGLQSKGGR